MPVLDDATKQSLQFAVAGALETGSHDALYELVELLIGRRDQEWNSAIGYTQQKISPLVLSPKEAESWLEKDRRRQVQNVVRESSPRFREVKHY